MDERDPIERFRASFARAAASEPFNASCAALATADTQARPSVRFVLVKEFDARGFVFYTHEQSRKGRELRENPWAALTFHWSSIGEQVRVEGGVERVSAGEADAYFATRPRGSQIGAWAGTQSQPISSRDDLERRVTEFAERFAAGDVPRPPAWGGFRLAAHSVEFWYDRADRLHDRVLYVRGGEGYQRCLLSP